MSYDHYKETEGLIQLLLDTPLQPYAKALQSAMEEGSTGTEIFMALRWNLSKLLEEASIEEAAKVKAERLVREIDQALI